MINLLPRDDRRQLAAARTNTLLLRYSVLLGMFIVLLIVEMVGIYFVINTGKMQNEATIKENETKAAGYADVKEQAASFQTNLATAKHILDKQTPYTKLIFTIAQSLPQGAVIEKLAIDPMTFGTPSTLSVKTTSYDRAIAVKTSLQNAKVNDKTPLFTAVSFQSVSSAEGGTTGASAYPFTAIYNVTYSKAALTP